MVETHSVVLKFGGTSVGDIARIKGVASVVERYRNEHPGDLLTVVVSAMAGETNRLVELCRAAGRDSELRERDVVLAAGEQVTSGLLGIALRDRGIDARSFLGWQLPIVTTDSFSEAMVKTIDASGLLAHQRNGGVAIVAGFQGVAESGAITTLGRGGSDITAVAIAAAIGARCLIYTDVPGVYSADPKICRGARLLTRVRHDEMLELASLGAKVLHTRSVFIAMQHQVPLKVLSTFRDAEHGTWIETIEGDAMNGNALEQPAITGVTCRLDDAQLTITGLPGEGLSRIFSVLSSAGIVAHAITQTQDGNGNATLSFSVPDERSDKALVLMRELVPQLGASGVGLERDVAKISVVGAGMRFNPEVTARIFRTLNQSHIPVKAVATSEITVSVIVPRKYSEAGVRALHAEFFG